jgi:thioredoxin-like negative regulator of GroEL
MDTTEVILIVVSLVLVASVLGFAWKKSQGRITRSTPHATEHATAPEVPRDVVDPHAVFTLLQFSGPLCSYCAAMRTILGAHVENNPGVLAHRELDITDYPELTSTLRVTQTPTTLLVTQGGHVHSRIRGAATARVVATEIQHALEARKAQSDGYRI